MYPVLTVVLKIKYFSELHLPPSILHSRQRCYLLVEPNSTSQHHHTMHQTLSVHQSQESKTTPLSNHGHCGVNKRGGPRLCSPWAGPSKGTLVVTYCGHWISHGLDKGECSTGARPDGVCSSILEESGGATLVYGTRLVIQPGKKQIHTSEIFTGENPLTSTHSKKRKNMYMEA